MIIAIPSKGRPNSVKSQKIIPSFYVYVPENELDSYSKCGVKNLVPVPINVKGITQTRNWILDNTDSPRVVFLDDDVKKAGWLEAQPENFFYHPMTEKEFVNEFHKLFDLTEQMQYRVWGIATMSAPRAFYPYKPIFFRSYLTASCMGILNYTKIRFNEEFKVKEDYEMGLRCVKEDGGFLAARYFFWENSHWTDDGGCKDYRTQEMEMDAINKLMKTYPNSIRRVTRGGSKYSIHLDF